MVSNTWGWFYWCWKMQKMRKSRVWIIIAAFRVSVLWVFIKKICGPFFPLKHASILPRRFYSVDIKHQEVQYSWPFPGLCFSVFLCVSLCVRVSVSLSFSASLCLSVLPSGQEWHGFTNNIITWGFMGEMIAHLPQPVFLPLSSVGGLLGMLFSFLQYILQYFFIIPEVSHWSIPASLFSFSWVKFCNSCKEYSSMFLRYSCFCHVQNIYSH